MRVLVLDPGERVGWCSAEVTIADPRSITQFDPILHVTGHGIAYRKDCAMATHQAVAIQQRYDLVIYERWALTAKGARVSVGSEMESSKFIGAVELSCWLSNTKIRKQPTSALSSADRSLKCGHPSATAVQEIIDSLPAAHDESHDRSALLHLWHWFFEEYV